MAALFAAVASVPSWAALVNQSISSSTGEDALAITDTSSALQWLSPIATRRLSISTVESGAGGWVPDGFRYATSAELVSLLQHAGVPALGLDTTSTERWYDPATIAAAQDLLTGLGWTYVNNAPSQGSPFGQREVYGILADAYLGDGQSPASRRYAWFGASDNVAYAYAVGGQWLFISEDSLVGSFLVRPTANEVPEPNTIWLLAATLVPVLSLGRRRRGQLREA